MAAPFYAVEDNPNPCILVSKIEDGAEATFTSKPRGIYVGSAGNIVAHFPDVVDTGIKFENVQAGTILPIRPIKIGNSAAGTTATKLIALF